MRNQDDNSGLDDDIEKIFKAVTLSDHMNPQARQKAKELMLMNVKNIVSDALKRSLYRDGDSNYLEMKDLMAIVQKKGDIYKFKLARTLVISQYRKDNNEKGDQKYSVGYGNNADFGHQPMEEK